MRRREGCEESRLLMSRRAMLGVTAGLFSWAFMPRFAEAATDDPRLLVVVLRGGMDGINVVVPFGDPHYVSMRGDIAIPTASTIRAQQLLRPASGDAEFRRDATRPGRRRSCTPPACRCATARISTAQDNLENGLPGLGLANATGWLNRLLTALPAGAPIKLERRHPDRRGAADPARPGAGARLVADLVRAGQGPDCSTSVRTLYRERDPQLLGHPRARPDAPTGWPSASPSDDGDVSALAQGLSRRRRADRAPPTARASRCFRSAAGTRIPTRAGARPAGRRARRARPRRSAISRPRSARAWSKTVVVLRHRIRPHRARQRRRGHRPWRRHRRAARRRRGQRRQGVRRLAGPCADQLYEDSDLQADHRPALGVQGHSARPYRRGAAACSTGRSSRIAAPVALPPRRS